MAVEISLARARELEALLELLAAPTAEQLARPLAEYRAQAAELARILEAAIAKASSAPAEAELARPPPPLDPPQEPVNRAAFPYSPEIVIQIDGDAGSPPRTLEELGDRLASGLATAAMRGALRLAAEQNLDRGAVFRRKRKASS